ncbi:MAG: PAS domain S-box protein [bacterium]|nr:PAS domain S-box protein [bacterium]
MQTPSWTKAVGESFNLLLDQINEAVIVLDGQRRLVHVNTRARRLLGYREDEQLDRKRCKLTTKGADCESACPLTFALETNLEEVTDFETVYHSRDGCPIPLQVTIIPLRDDRGRSAGAVEILRPTEPDFGFFLAGNSVIADGIRQRLKELVSSRETVIVVGDSLESLDVARALHRLSGLSNERFVEVQENEPLNIDPWPPGTLYQGCYNGQVCRVDDIPTGWRVVIGASSNLDGVSLPGEAQSFLRLPSLAELKEDLPVILTALAHQVDGRTRLTPAAIEYLLTFALENGLGASRDAMVRALGASGGTIDVAHLCVGGSETVYVEELLQASDPLAASEACLIREVLCRCGWRMQEAADRLGISRVTLWRKLREHGIEK